MTDVLKQMTEKLYEGDDDAVAELTQKALDAGMTAEEVLKGGLLAGMDQVGVDFRAGDLFVPEVLIAARAMHAGMDILSPLLSEADVPSAGKVVLGTVKGDLHDIGKNLVGMMLEGGGFEIIDLGTDVPPEKFAEAVRTEQAGLVGMSALLTTTMPSMKRHARGTGGPGRAGAGQGDDRRCAGHPGLCRQNRRRRLRARRGLGGRTGAVAG